MRGILKFPAWAWAASFLLLRLLFLVANNGYIFDLDEQEISTWLIDRDSHNVYFSEEFTTTSLARELARGNKQFLDGISLSHGGVTGGEYLQFLLYAGVARVLGDSYYAMKSVPILFSTLTALAMLLLVQVCLRPLYVHLLGLLLLVGFPSFFLSGFSGMGNHMEMGLFLIISFIGLIIWRRSSNVKRQMLGAVIAGVVAGLSYFYNFLTFVYLLWLAGFMLIGLVQRKGRIKWLVLVVFPLAFTVGYLPYFYLSGKVSVEMTNARYH